MPITDPEKLRESRRRDYARPGRKEAIRESNRRRRDARREQLRAIKLATGCERCGFDECASALEFHREPSEKSFALGSSRAWDLAEATLLEEVEKCIVLCANCHRRETCRCCNPGVEPAGSGARPLSA